MGSGINIQQMVWATWERVLAIVEELRGAPWAKFRDRHGDWGRDFALFLGRSACGLPLRTLGRAVGELSEAAVCVAVQRFAGRLAKEKPLRQMVESARNLLNVNA